MWWIHLPEGYGLDASVRGALLAVALGRLTQVVVHAPRGDAPWHRLLSARERGLLGELTATLEQKQAGLAELMDAAAKLLVAGDDPPIDVPEVITSLVCLPGHAVLPCDMPNTRLVMTNVDVLGAAAALRGYEQCFAFAPFGRGAAAGSGTLPEGVAALPAAVDREVFKPLSSADGAPRRVLVISRGDTPAALAQAQHLSALADADILLFEPHVSALSALPPRIAHLPALPPSERAAAFAGCAAVWVADATGTTDNHFLWEAVACGAVPLGAYLQPGTAVSDATALRGAVHAWLGGAPPARTGAIADFRDVATQILHAPMPRSVAWQAPAPRAPVRLPVLLTCHGGNHRSRLVKRRHLGINVASNLIFEGLEAAAPGRFDVRWLDYQDPDTTRGRFYVYPVGAVEGRTDAKEFDYHDWPARLRDGTIDAMCSGDPVIDDMLGARQLWATRAVPVIGMLHSVHGHSLAFQWLLHLLQYETFDFDVVISPSRCGATVFRETYASALAWHQAHTRLPAPPEPRVEVVPYGIDRALYAGLDRATCRHTLGLPNDEVLLLSLGRFSRREKADMLPLLLALYNLRRTGLPVTLLLVGGAASPPYVQHLRDAVASLGLNDAVRFFEGAPAEDKRLLLGAADIFVSISDNVQETYGLAIVEAMAAGLPVVASAWNGAREIVRPGETGFLVPTIWQPPEHETDQVARLGSGVMGYGHRDLHESVVVDIPALTAHLRDLAGNHALRARMGARARALCAEHYDAHTQGCRIGDVIVSAMEQAARHAWRPDPARGPFMSETVRRFAHYPEGAIDDTRVLEVTALGADPGLRKHVLRAALDPGCPQELLLAQRIVGLAQAHPGMTVAALSAAVAGPGLTVARARLRVVRCWKYGLLQPAVGTCS